MTTLETGSGGSTIVFAAAQSQHTAISPDPEEHSNIRDWCESNGLSAERIAFIAAPSHVALTEIWAPEPLDLVLVDGAHGYPYPSLDWFYTASHLRTGGWMVIDDAFLPSVNALVTFLDESRDWEMQPLGYRTVAFRKVADRTNLEWEGSRFNRRLSFNYLPPVPRLLAWLRYLMIDRSKLGQQILSRLRRS